MFNYNRQLTESFNYYNIMKNSSMSEQLKLQEQELQSNERRTKNSEDNSQKNMLSFNLVNKGINSQLANTDTITAIKQKSNTSANPSSNRKK